MGPLDTNLLTLRVRPGVRFGQLGPLFLQFFAEAPTADDLRARETTLRRLRDRAGGFALLSVIDGTLNPTLPDAESRSVTASHAELVGSSLHTISVVIEAEGLWGTTIRSFLRAQRLVKRTRADMRFFDDVEAGARHCLRSVRADGERELARVQDAVSTLRAEARALAKTA